MSRCWRGDVRSSFHGATSSPTLRRNGGEDGAGDRTRTDDLTITNRLLYLLSYAGSSDEGGLPDNSPIGVRAPSEDPVKHDADILPPEVHRSKSRRLRQGCGFHEDETSSRPRVPVSLLLFPIW